MFGGVFRFWLVRGAEMPESRRWIDLAAGAFRWDFNDATDGARRRRIVAHRAHRAIFCPVIIDRHLVGHPKFGHAEPGPALDLGRVGRVVVDHDDCLTGGIVASDEASDFLHHGLFLQIILFQRTMRLRSTPIFSTSSSTTSPGST